MSFCEEHGKFDEKMDHLVEVVTRIDHGLNGVNGSIGLVKRVENMETVITKNAPIWSKMRGLGSNITIMVRTLAIAALMAIGGYLWAIIMGAGR
jgi:hypothetical protein